MPVIFACFLPEFHVNKHVSTYVLLPFPLPKHGRDTTWCLFLKPPHRKKPFIFFFSTGWKTSSHQQHPPTTHVWKSWKIPAKIGDKRRHAMQKKRREGKVQSSPETGTEYRGWFHLSTLIPYNCVVPRCVFPPGCWKGGGGRLFNWCRFSSTFFLLLLVLG